MTRIGIMQGRLTPPVEGRIQCFPRERWQDEFALAAECDLECMEWTHDLLTAEVNPVFSDAGISTMKALSARHHVQILSLCADYYMDRPLLRASAAELEDRVMSLENLMQRCRLAGISRITLPFVDASRMETEAEMDGVCRVLERALKSSELTGVELHLETSLAPDAFARFLAQLPHPMLKVNYDSGNSASLGYDPRQEFAGYGERIGSVHIKDRVLGGSTVPLGTGNADFGALADCLKQVGYKGDFILQVARGKTGQEVAWAKKNREFVLAHLLS